MPDIVSEILAESAHIVGCGSKKEVDKIERMLRSAQQQYRGTCVNTHSNLDTIVSKIASMHMEI